jgi:hypothetical protein
MNYSKTCHFGHDIFIEISAKRCSDSNKTQQKKMDSVLRTMKKNPSVSPQPSADTSSYAVLSFHNSRTKMKGHH